MDTTIANMLKDIPNVNECIDALITSNSLQDVPLGRLKHCIRLYLELMRKEIISGKYVDIGKFKGPILRGLAVRAPYFHNGFAKDFDAVIDFYNTRFNLNLSPQQHRDLVAFLRTL